MDAARPRIAILAPLKDWGGLERKFAILSQEFVLAGFTPEFVRIRGGKLPYPDLLPVESRSVELRTRSKWDGVFAVARYLRRTPPAAVVTARDHSAQVAVLARRLARVRVPVFVKVTNMPSEVIRRPLQIFMGRRLYRHADGVIAISEGVAADVRRFLDVPDRKVHVIYNPTITRDFAQRCEQAIDSPWLAEETRVPVIVGAGRLMPQKDFRTLIDAFARVRAQRDARLLILGEGAERSQLERRVAELGLDIDVALPGKVPDPVPYMHRASLFAFSSRYEGLGNVLIEALASGTRLVSTDCPSGPREILADGRYGRLVPPGDPEALARSIMASLDDPRPDRHSVAAASSRFRAPEVAARYLRLMGWDVDTATA